MHCPICGTDSAAADALVAYCARCGSPLRRAAEAAQAPFPSDPRVGARHATWPAARSPQRWIVAILLVILISLVLVTGWFLLWRADRGGAVTPSPSSTHQENPSADDSSTPSISASDSAIRSAARDQATAIDQLLDLSGPSRGALGTALEQARDCATIDEGIATIQQVAQERHNQAGESANLVVDAIDNGETIKQLLIQALNASKRADMAYLRWAQRYAENGCTGAVDSDPDFDAGNAASIEATAAKAGFVAEWNPVAEREGLPTRAEFDI